METLYSRYVTQLIFNLYSEDYFISYDAYLGDWAADVHLYT